MILQRTIHVPLGVSEVRVKNAQLRQLLLVRDRHVVLNRVEAAQHEVKNADLRGEDGEFKK